MGTCCKAEGSSKLQLLNPLKNFSLAYAFAEGTVQKAFLAVLSPEDAELPSFQFLSSQVAGRSGFQALLHSLGVQAPKVPLQMETQPLQWAV